MNVTISVVLTLVAVACFAIATAIAAAWFGITDGNVFAWIAGGLTLFALAHLPWRA